MIKPLLDKITNRLNENLHAILPKKKKHCIKRMAFWLVVGMVGTYGIPFNRSDAAIIDLFFSICFLVGPLAFIYYMEQFFIHRKKYKGLCKNDSEFLSSTQAHEILLPDEVSELLSYQFPDYAAKIIYERVAAGGKITYNDVVEMNRLLSIDKNIHEKTKTTRITAIENNVEKFVKEHNLNNQQLNILSSIIEQHIPVQHNKTFNSKKVL